MLVLVWLGFEIHSARGGQPRHYLLTREEVLQSKRVRDGWQLPRFNGSYSQEAHPSNTGILFNGEGWSDGAGIAGPVVVLAVDQPRFVELLVSPRLSGGQPGSVQDVYRAKMASEKLPVESVCRDGENIRVRFKIPEQLRRGQDDQLLFLCFIRDCTKEDRSSERMLQSVRWR